MNAMQRSRRNAALMALGGGLILYAWEEGGKGSLYQRPVQVAGLGSLILGVLSLGMSYGLIPSP